MRSESGWAIWSPRDGLLIQTVRKTSEDAWCAMLKSVGFEREAWERDGFRAEQVTVSTFLCGPPYPSNANLRAEAASAEAVREACVAAVDREAGALEALIDESDDLPRWQAQKMPVVKKLREVASMLRSLPLPSAPASAEAAPEAEGEAV